MELEKPLSADQPTAPDAPDVDAPVPAELSPVLVISRETFNYVVIAITFLIVGDVIGTLLTNRANQSTRELISEAVAAAMELQNANTAAAAGPDLNDPNTRLDVSTTCMGVSAVNGCLPVIIS